MCLGTRSGIYGSHCIHTACRTIASCLSLNLWFCFNFYIILYCYKKNLETKKGQELPGSGGGGCRPQNILYYKLRVGQKEKHLPNMPDLYELLFLASVGLGESLVVAETRSWMEEKVLTHAPYKQMNINSTVTETLDTRGLQMPIGNSYSWGRHLAEWLGGPLGCLYPRRGSLV